MLVPPHAMARVRYVLNEKARFFDHALRASECVVDKLVVPVAGPRLV